MRPLILYVAASADGLIATADGASRVIIERNMPSAYNRGRPAPAVTRPEDFQ